jgi:MFS family permease
MAAESEKASALGVDPVIATGNDSPTTGSANFESDTSPVRQFDPIAEKKLRRKTDLYIVPLVALLFLFCFIDRSNLGNARIADLEKDLGMNPASYDFNIVLSIFYVSYALFEVPSTLLCKLVGPGWYLPVASILFGIATICTAFVKTKGQLIAVRFILGIFEAGMLPGIAYYLSRWYRRSELSFRLGMYMVTTPLAGAFGGLLASGILSLDKIGSLRGWRMIFMVEGIITTVLGLIALAFLTDSPMSARWLSAEEKELAIERIKSERVGQDEVLDKMNRTKLKRGVLNPITLSTAFIFHLNNITALGISFFLPTIIRAIYPGETRVQQQLRTVPPYILGAATLMVASYLASRYNTRQIFLIATGPLVMVGYAMLLAVRDPETRYGAIFLTVSTVFFPGPLCNSQVSANSVSDSSRSIAIATNTVAGYLGGLIATWTYFGTDPMFPVGNGLNLSVSAAISATAATFHWYMIRDNKKRDLKSPAEREELLAGLSRREISELEYKHPDFRWRP